MKKVYWSHIDFEVSNRSVQIYIWIYLRKHLYVDQLLDGVFPWRIEMLSVNKLQN